MLCLILYLQIIYSTINNPVVESVLDRKENVCAVKTTACKLDTLEKKAGRTECKTMTKAFRGLKDTAEDDFMKWL